MIEDELIQTRRVEPIKVRCPHCRKLNGELWRGSTRWRLRVPNRAERQYGEDKWTTLSIRVKRGRSDEVTEFDLGADEERVAQTIMGCWDCRHEFALKAALRRWEP